MMQSLNAVEGHLRETVETGQLAQHTLERMSEMSDLSLNQPA